MVYVPTMLLLTVFVFALRPFMFMANCLGALGEQLRSVAFPDTK
jgi:hypothetical protein